MTNQREFVLNQLHNQGYITRNFCLSNFISRLGAIICDLVKEGYDIKGEWLKTDSGRDFIYRITPRQTGLF